MTIKTTRDGKKHFCPYCSHRFSSSRVLGCHVKYCLEKNHKKSVLLLEENKYANFQYSKRLTKA